VRRIFTCLICMGLLLSGSSRGSADSNAPDFDQTGVYIAAGAAFALTTQIENALEDDLESIGAFGLDVDQETIYGYKIRAGWRYHAAGAFEAEFERGIESDLSVDGLDVIESNSWTAMLNFKLFPIGGRFQPYAMFGAGVLHVDWEGALGIGISDTNNDAAVRFGGGLDVYATEHVFLFLDASYVLPAGDLRKYDYASFGAGLGYRW
jgi:opacity protein-like surface antigen